MPTNKLKELQKGFGRALLIRSCPQGPILAELQDHVEDLDAAFAANTDIAANTSAISALQTRAGKIEAAFVAVIPVSFETGQLGTYTFYFPKAATVTKIRAFANKAIAGTDDATIQAKNNAGTNMASGLITFTAADPFATEKTVSPSTNNTFTAGQKLQLLTAKTTAGGSALVFVEYTLT